MRGLLVYLGSSRRHAELLNAAELRPLLAAQGFKVLMHSLSHTHVRTNTPTEVAIDHPRRTD